jgi:phage baseplate assembly protein W
MDFKFIGSRDQVYQGTRNDVMFDPVSKDVTVVTGSDYVKQKIVKILLTSVNSDPNFVTYGSQLDDQIFQSASDPNVQQAIVSTIINALNYTEVQETSVNDADHIASIDNVELIAQPDQQTIYIQVAVTLRSGQILTLAVGS